MWKAVTMVAVTVFALSGCAGGGHVAAVPAPDGGTYRGAGGYAEHPYRAATQVAELRFYKAMGVAYHLAEREAAELFSALRKGWKGFGYIAAGQAGRYTIPGWSGADMSAALGSLPGDTCRDVTERIAGAYGDLRESLKSGTRAKHVEAASGAAKWAKAWQWRSRNDC